MNESKQIAMWILILAQLIQINNSLVLSNGFNIGIQIFTPLALTLLGSMLFLTGIIKDKGDESK